MTHATIRIHIAKPCRCQSITCGLDNVIGPLTGQIFACAIFCNFSPDWFTYFIGVQYWSLLNWRKNRFRCDSVAVLVHWNFVVISPWFAIFKNVVHSVEPGETPRNILKRLRLIFQFTYVQYCNELDFGVLNYLLIYW